MHVLFLTLRMSLQLHGDEINVASFIPLVFSKAHNAAQKLMRNQQVIYR